MTSIKVPPLGESIVEATVSRWLKKEGDAVAPGDTLVELETDKITVEVPAMNGGVLTKRAHAEGDIVHVDDLLAEIDESATANAQPAAAQPAPAKPPEGAAPAPRNQPQSTPVVPPPPPAAPPAQPAAEVRAGPAAQKAAAETGVDLSRVQGTGRGGVVSKPDVLEAAAGAQRVQAPAPPAAPQPTAPTPAPRPAAPSAPR